VRYLLDTCVISEVVRPDPDAAVVSWLNARREEDLFLSVITVAEIQKGIHKLDASHRRRQLQDWLENDLRKRFSGRLLPIDDEVAMICGQLQGQGERDGQPLPVMDCLIAATSIAHHLAVATRNVADLQRCSATVINPWLD
jgi:predicted nucleic acid-binding protein